MGTTAAVVAIAASAYGTYQASQAGKMKPNLPKAPAPPKLPNTASLAASTKQGDILAKTAGGSILSNPRENQGLGDAPNTVRKTLLGT